MAGFVQRMIGASKLDVRTYEEVEMDTGSLGQAMGVVLLSSLAAGIGAASGIRTGNPWALLVAGLITALAGWFIWAFIIYLIGTRMLPEPQTRADMGELLRTIGFASSPGVIRIIGVIPGLQTIVFLVAQVWMLAAMIIAVRQALDYSSTARAVGVCVIGWIVQGLIIGLVYAVFGGPKGPA